MFDRRCRVIVWATGPIGRASLYNVLTSHDMELVGVWVHSADKEGKDAGDIVGLPKCGVICTRDKQKVLAQRADVIMYCPTMPLVLDDLVNDVLEVLESGKSVVTPTGLWFLPQYGEAYVAKVQEVCARKGVHLYGGGENPGFWLERLGVTATSLCSDVTSIKLEETVDVGLWPSWVFVNGTMGFGNPVESMTEDNPIVQMYNRSFSEEIRYMGQALGFGIDRIHQHKPRYATLAYETKCVAGVLPANTVVAQAFGWTGMEGERSRITIQNTWFVSRELPAKEWPIQDHWVISIVGRPCVKIRADTPVSLEDPSIMRYSDSNTGTIDYVTAMPLMNAIPDVLALPPGIIYPHMWGSNHQRRFAAAARLRKFESAPTC